MCVRDIKIGFHFHLLEIPTTPLPYIVVNIWAHVFEYGCIYYYDS